jgi:hypothetical protein
MENREYHWTCNLSDCHLKKGGHEQEACTAETEPTSFTDSMARYASRIQDHANSIKELEKDEDLYGWNFDDQDGEQDEELLLPPLQKFLPGSIDHLDEQMRDNGGTN